MRNVSHTHSKSILSLKRSRMIPRFIHSRRSDKTLTIWLTVQQWNDELLNKLVQYSRRLNIYIYFFFLFRFLSPRHASIVIELAKRERIFPQFRTRIENAVSHGWLIVMNLENRDRLVNFKITAKRLFAGGVWRDVMVFSSRLMVESENRDVINC